MRGAGGVSEQLQPAQRGATVFVGELVEHVFDERWLEDRVSRRDADSGIGETELDLATIDRVEDARDVALIDEASKRYDHIIVDGPPILGLADAPLLSRAVEATVLVIEAGKTPATRARHAIDRLFGVRTHIVGAILTKFDLKTTGYGYGYGYEYHYGQRDEEKRALAQKLGKMLPRRQEGD